MVNIRRRTPRLGLSLLIVSLALLPACQFTVGMGDPEESKVDRELFGHWVHRAGKNVSVVSVTAKKDGKSYEFRYLTCEGALDAPKRKKNSRSFSVAGQAWLTGIGDKRFVTVKVSKPQNKKPYMIFRIERSDDTLTLVPLNDQFAAFRTAKTAKEMEAAVRANLDNNDAFSAGGDFQRTTAEAIKKVVELFKES